MRLKLTDEIFNYYGAGFLSHIDKTENCWTWTGAKAVKNARHTPVYYGEYAIRFPRIEKYYAHRFSYEFFKGPIPDGFQIDHVCKNTLCVNPDHLEAVTPKTNVLRGNTIAAKNKTKTHCPKGHPYDIKNTYIVRKYGREMRECRICRKISHDRWRANKKRS